LDIIFPGAISMATENRKEARISFRLSNESMEVIENAATAMGQSVSDYAIATLVKNSQAVLHEIQSTVLLNRDRQAFMALVDSSDVKPNRSLAAAAKRYKKRFK
jgi:uncharacterized protein (DUF1778 family)